MRRQPDGDTAERVSSAFSLQSPPRWLEGQLTTGKSTDVFVSHLGEFIHLRQCSFRCDVYKRTAAPADAKTRESAGPQQLVANTKTERREVSGGRALVSQLNAVCSFGGQSNFF